MEVLDIKSFNKGGIQAKENVGRVISGECSRGGGDFRREGS